MNAEGPEWFASGEIPGYLIGAGVVGAKKLFWGNSCGDSRWLVVALACPARSCFSLSW